MFFKALEHLSSMFMVEDNIIFGVDAQAVHVDL